MQRSAQSRVLYQMEPSTLECYYRPVAVIHNTCWHMYAPRALLISGCVERGILVHRDTVSGLHNPPCAAWRGEMGKPCCGAGTLASALGAQVAAHKECPVAERVVLFNRAGWWRY